MMDADLQKHLLERLAHRAERLAKIARLPHGNIPTILGLMTEHVVSTAVLLFPEEVSRSLLTKIITDRRDATGICFCGNRKIADGKIKLCQKCIDNCDSIDKELDAQEAMDRPTIGEPS